MTLVQLAEMHERAERRLRERISAQVENEKSVFYSRKDELEFLKDIDTLQVMITRINKSIMKRL